MSLPPTITPSNTYVTKADLVSALDEFKTSLLEAGVFKTPAKREKKKRKLEEGDVSTGKDDTITTGDV